jgi:hypothetical protein
MVDKNLRVGEALRASWHIVLRRGLWLNLVLMLLSLALTIGPLAIPYVGSVLSWFVSPLGWLVVASGYIQQVREHEADLIDLLPQGFAVQVG